MLRCHVVSSPGLWSENCLSGTLPESCAANCLCSNISRSTHLSFPHINQDGTWSYSVCSPQFFSFHLVLCLFLFWVFTCCQGVYFCFSPVDRVWISALVKGCSMLQLMTKSTILLTHCFLISGKTLERSIQSGECSLYKIVFTVLNNSVMPMLLHVSICQEFFF